MAVGILHLELRLLSPRSLKEKRSILKPLKIYLQKNHGVSVAEVAHQDSWQLTGLEIALSQMTYHFSRPHFRNSVDLWKTNFL